MTETARTAGAQLDPALLQRRAQLIDRDLRLGRRPAGRPHRPGDRPLRLGKRAVTTRRPTTAAAAAARARPERQRPVGRHFLVDRDRRPAAGAAGLRQPRLIATVGCKRSGTARKGRETEGKAVITAFKREDRCLTSPPGPPPPPLMFPASSVSEKS
eukprot:SAG22_NODE_575_length_8991_cov_12.134859_5_plen_157_part_00